METTEATVHETQKTAAIHHVLLAKELPPGEHIVDSTYIDAELLVISQQQQAITLIGPTRSNNRWQTKVAGTYDIDQFAIDWAQQQVGCPQGKLSAAWHEGVTNADRPVIYAYFHRQDC